MMGGFTQFLINEDQLDQHGVREGRQESALPALRGLLEAQEQIVQSLKEIVRLLEEK